MVKDKEKVKKNLHKKLIGDAIEHGKAVVLLEERPCSVEISRTAKGDITFSLKTYVRNEKEMLSVIPELSKIKDAINKQFED